MKVMKPKAKRAVAHAKHTELININTSQQRCAIYISGWWLRHTGRVVYIATTKLLNTEPG